VTAVAIPARQLACILADTAAGIPADSAAVELLARHDHFLHLPEFRRLIAAGSAISSGEPVAVIRWRATVHALDRGQLPCTRTEAAVLRIAASIGDDARRRAPAHAAGRPRPSQHHPGHRRDHPRQ
jgi:hypothetical protein